MYGEVMRILTNLARKDIILNQLQILEKELTAF